MSDAVEKVEVTLSGGSADGMIMRITPGTNEIRTINDTRPGWFEVRSYRPIGDGTVWTMREAVDPKEFSDD